MEKEEKKEEWIIPGYPPLKKDLIGEAAIKDQIVYYPKISRAKNDPLIDQRQTFGCFAIKLFSKPCQLKTGKNVYGFIKLRGNFESKEVAKEKMEELVLNFDSNSLNFIVNTGCWVPLSEEVGFSKEVKNVEEISQSEKEIEKEKEKKREEISRELNTRLKELTEEQNQETEEDLDFYTQKRVVLLNLISERDRIEKTALPNIKEKISSTLDVIAGLDKKFPEYQNMWVERWNKERKKAGIPDYNPM